MKDVRRQATLYLKGKKEVDLIRHRFDPAQANIIGTHITLCREDEVENWDELAELVEFKKPSKLLLNFGLPQRDKNFVWLPCEDDSEFDRLRAEMLGPTARKQTPHLTLIHPRKGYCTDTIFAEITAAYAPFSYSFEEIAFIEQTDGGVWKVLETFGLGKSM